ncbi:hypothetical protein [Streptomyces inhibens]|uniref:hypothetical protein n=1 Tax=Streptomyces inhibens TaxID=2293571 RepID=UPI001EE6A618|nr:hypothetical protein [Streptomyces inhibens]UKY47807.1 hypothetical protein KI385_02480 [Streptomyces inhibens]
MPSQLAPLAEALTPNPYTVLDWLSTSRSAALLAELAELAEHRSDLTHDVLDALPQTRVTRHVRAVLVTTGVLPPRQERLAQMNLWLDKALGHAPPPHRQVVRPFAEWGLLRHARRSAAHDRYSGSAARRDRSQVQAALDFLSWLDDEGLDLSSLAQEHLDRWLATRPARYDTLHAFIRWATARHLTGPLTLPSRPRSSASHFLTETAYEQQLRRCLNDETLQRELRIAGALICLYALPVSRIIELTTSRFHREGQGTAYLTFERHPVLLPPKLARLIEDQIIHRSTTNSLNHELGASDRYLLPGTVPGSPIDGGTLAKLLGEKGLPVRAARNTAMIEAVTSLPPIVVADLLGLHPATVGRWSDQANDSWASYLAARPKA